MLRRGPFLAGGVAASMLPLRALAAQTNYAANGGATVTSSDTTWVDAKRSRSVPIRLDITEGEPHGAIVFSHGLGGNVASGETWGRQWATWGYVVAHLDHPGSDTAAVRTGGVENAMTPDQFLARIADVRFIADEIARRAAAGERPWSQIDPNRLGMSGHSFGAITTLAIAGETFGGRSFADPRFVAAVALSPAPNRFGGDGDRAIHIPFLSVTGSQDAIFGVGPDQRVLPYQAMPGPDAYLLWIDGARHNDFNGAARNSGPNVAAVEAASTAFWCAFLDGDAARRAQAQTAIRSGAAVTTALRTADRFDRKVARS